MVQAREVGNSAPTAAIEAAARELVSMRQSGPSHFLNLPLIYPDGSCVTVKIDELESGLRVSDNGFAYREIESVGAERSFRRTANRIADEAGVLANRRVIYVDVPTKHLIRAICDVATASWRVADHIYERLSDDEEAEIAEALRGRLTTVFGMPHLRDDHKITGSSTNEWDVSAIVNVDDQIAVFHAVGKHANAIFRTATAFHDIAAVENPPQLVSVVKDKAGLGANLALLAQAGRVIQADDSDQIFRRAAA